MESYEHDSWLHLQQCELIGEDGGFREIIVKDGCSTDAFLYQLQGSQNNQSFIGVKFFNYFFNFKKFKTETILFPNIWPLFHSNH